MSEITVKSGERTPLHDAAQRADAGLTKSILDAGADVLNPESKSIGEFVRRLRTVKSQ